MQKWEAEVKCRGYRMAEAQDDNAEGRKRESPIRINRIEITVEVTDYARI